jgi:hypothetical protein
MNNYDNSRNVILNNEPEISIQNNPQSQSANNSFMQLRTIDNQVSDNHGDYEMRKSSFGKRFLSLDYDANNYCSKSFEVIP